MFNMKNLKRRFAHPKRQETEIEVQPGLSITPAEMYQMMKEGKPITAANLPDSNFYDGDSNPSFEIPLEMKKGIDPADLWENQQEIYSKHRQRRKDNAKLGEDLVNAN